MNVVFSKNIRKYFRDLVPILYEKGYFILFDTAEKYVYELFDDITINLPTKQHKPAPAYFDKYGKNMYYAIFKKNRRTSWYVFF